MFFWGAHGASALSCWPGLLRIAFSLGDKKKRIQKSQEKSDNRDRKRNGRAIDRITASDSPVKVKAAKIATKRTLFCWIRQLISSPRESKGQQNKPWRLLVFPDANEGIIGHSSYVLLSHIGEDIDEMLTACRIDLPEDQALVIGRKIWYNECHGTEAGLTTWNNGEEFASLGIGHFIWYPAGACRPYRESFPQLLAYLKSQPGVDLPAWLAEDLLNVPCPWSSKAEFDADLSSTRMRELRALLAATIPEQCRFLTARLQQALPEMVQSVPEKTKRREIAERFYQVARERMGPYVLMDYTNFKGEGTKETERYKQEGWGLLQVLENMEPFWQDGAASATEAFVRAGKHVLKRRVENSPPERGESRWLRGWSKRLDSYLAS